jgi:ArsR family transcriptional regulator
MADLASLPLAEIEASAGKAADLLHALGNEKRLMILCRLGAGEHQAGALRAPIGLSQSALSQHLAVLRRAGIVAARRDGQAIWYRISDPAAVQMIAALASVFCPDSHEPRKRE